MPEARYDSVADFYATAFNAIDDPAGAALLDLVGSPASLRILDLACGHGRITRELARRGAAVLRPGGRFVFAFLHPCFPGAPGASASWPPSARYYDEGRWTADAELSTLRRQVGAQHRMLSTYLNAFRRHGLWLDELREPVPAPRWADGRPRADRVPVFVAGRCLKVQISSAESG